MTMRRGLVAIAFAAAGCNGGSGLDIEVHAGSQTFDSVQLWLAYDTCHRADGTDCDSIAWPNAPKRVAGHVLTLGRDERVFEVPVIDGVGQLHLETPAGSENPIAMAVVGVKGGNLVGVKVITDAIRLHSQEHWIIELDDAGQVTANDTADPGDAPPRNALVWARQPSSTLPDAQGYTGCLAYQEWDGTRWGTKFFVPSTDPDCDGDPPDCDLYAYEASAATAPNARCATRAPMNTAFERACVVGAPMCPREDATLTCTPETPLICIPDAICSVCGDIDTAACLKGVAVERLMMRDNLIPLQRCPMQINGSSSSGTPCVNNGQGGWVVQFFVPGDTCNSSGPGGLTAELRPLLQPFTPASGSITLSNGALLHISGTPLVSPQTGCVIDITWGDTSVSSPGPVAALATVNYSGTHIVFPVIFDFEATTTCPTVQTPSQCEASGAWPGNPGGVADTMFDCANNG